MANRMVIQYADLAQPEDGTCVETWRKHRLETVGERASVLGRIAGIDPLREARGCAERDARHAKCA